MVEAEFQPQLSVEIFPLEDVRGYLSDAGLRAHAYMLMALTLSLSEPYISKSFFILCITVHYRIYGWVPEQDWPLQESPELC